MENKEKQQENKQENKGKPKACIYGGECTECVPGGCAD